MRLYYRQPFFCPNVLLIIDVQCYVILSYNKFSLIESNLRMNYTPIEVLFIHFAIYSILQK